MPVDPATKKSKGFAFIEFADPRAAPAALASLAGYKLDKAHTLAAYRFDDVDRYAAVPETYAPPPPRTYTPSENLQAWMLDRRGRDQFAVRAGDEAEVYWHDAPRLSCEKAYARSFWSDAFVLWSPRGTFLATVHRQGIAVWGGESFARIQRYAHPGVQRIDFSPGEKFLVSYSATEPSGPRDRAMATVHVFDVATGARLRTFEGPADEWAVGTSAAPGGGPGWPLFKWAGGGDDKYVARLGRGVVSVYELPSMGLLDKKSLKLDGVVDFQWSPGPDPIIAAYQTEQQGGNVPARIALIRIPDRRELRQKQIFAVADVRVHWHPQGTYLAVEVSRFTKTRKSTFTSFELFTLEDGANGAIAMEVGLSERCPYPYPNLQPLTPTLTLIPLLCRSSTSPKRMSSPISRGSRTAPASASCTPTGRAPRSPCTTWRRPKGRPRA